jgi:hypothetical protein
MTKHDRTLQNKITDSTPLPVMHVAAADTGLLDVHADIAVVAQLGDGAVLDRDVFYAVKYECGVLLPSEQHLIIKN